MAAERLKKDIYRVLEVTTTVGCGIGCAYCPQDRFTYLQREVSAEKRLSLETFTQCLANVPAEVDISFAGYSEPWLNPMCTDMIEAAHARGHSLRVFTTAVGMTQEDVARLAAVHPKLLVIHVFDDGAHMDTRFVNEGYLRVLDRITAMAFPDLRFLQFGEGHPAVLNRIRGQRVVTTRPLISRAGNVRASIVPKAAELLGPLSCSESREYRNVLLPNGDVTLCCMDYGRKHVLGNLLIQDYQSLLDGEEFSAVRRKMGGEEGYLLCRSCELAEPL